MTSIFIDQHSVIICIGEPFFLCLGFRNTFYRLTDGRFLILSDKVPVSCTCVCVRNILAFCMDTLYQKDSNRLSQCQITVGKFWCIVRKIERLAVVRKLLLVATPTTGNVALVYVLSPNPTWAPLPQLFPFSLVSVCLGNEAKLKLSNPWLTFNISVTMPHALTKYIKLLYSERAIPSQRYLMI